VLRIVRFFIINVTLICLFQLIIQSVYFILSRDIKFEEDFASRKSHEPILVTKDEELQLGPLLSSYILYVAYFNDILYDQRPSHENEEHVD
jgi:hypothetical protein